MKRARLIKIVFIALISTFFLLGLAACAFLSSSRFGELPQGSDLERMRQSPHYVNDHFRNEIDTPMFSDDSSFISVLFYNTFTEKNRPRPVMPVPVVKTDLKALDSQQDLIIWLGHSSYYMQLDGRRILVDPVFSAYASPFSWANRAFEGTNLYIIEDMPEIDYLLITHDHWDHLDYPTVTALQGKVGKVITGLGVGTDLRYWGYPAEKVIEADWHSKAELEKGFTIHVLPARHFSGRLFRRNKTLWVAFAIETNHRRIFISGDTGYGPHFKKIGEAFDGFDLAIMENGQYDKKWPYIHMMPEETAQATIDLKAYALLPAHAGKFSISNHSWDEPFIRLKEASRDKDFLLLTPRIGEPLFLNQKALTFDAWWQEIH